MDDKMHILMIDTATDRAILALASNGKVVQKIEFLPGERESQSVMPVVERLFVANHLSPTDLGGIIVGVGPGSYTGVRVGVAVAKTIAFAKNIPLVSVSTMEALVPQSFEGPFAALIDARVAGFYLATGEKKCITTAPRICSVQDLSQEIEGISHIITPNYQKVGAKMASYFAIPYYTFEERAPAAERFLEIGLHKFASGQTVKPDEVEIMYLRSTQAEREFKDM